MFNRFDDICFQRLIVEIILYIGICYFILYTAKTLFETKLKIANKALAN